MSLANYAASVLPTGYNNAYQGMEHTPVGNLAAFKGDLLYPLFTMGFFILGVILIVKTILGMLGLIKAKVGGSILDDTRSSRKRRSAATSNADLDELNALTTVMMAAMDSQECLQRMTCELGGFVRKYDNNQLIASIGERLTPKHLVPNFRIFKMGDNCDKYRCGHLAYKK